MSRRPSRLSGSPDPPASTEQEEVSTGKKKGSGNGSGVDAVGDPGTRVNVVDDETGIRNIIRMIPAWGRGGDG